MSFLSFMLEAILVSLSGVMAPGPMTTMVIGKGNESPHAGALVAVGHGIVEGPLMIAVFYGVGRVLDQARVQAAIAIVGGAFLLLMSAGMFRKLKAGDVQSSQSHRSPVGAGILLSLGNPYFLVWWATVGATLVMRSVQFGVMGFVALAVVHWSCDFAWSYFLSALSYKGGQFFGRGFQRGIFVTCGVLLVFFSGKLIFDGAVVFLA